MPPQLENNADYNNNNGPIKKRKEIYYDGYMYDVTDWIPKHPGGTIINYYTDDYEDSTIAIQQFHHRSIKQVLAKLNSFKKYPATLVHGFETQAEWARHQKLTREFQELYQDFLRQGIFEPSLTHTAGRLLEVVLFLCIGLFFNANPDIFMAGPMACFFLIIYFTRCSFLVHEAGHGSLTGNTDIDRFLEAVLFTLGVGFSSTWWSSQHNRHHAMPQRMDRDVDLKTLPLIAFNTTTALEVKRKLEGNNFFTRNQAKLFFLMDTVLVGIFWKTITNPSYIFRKRQYTQMIFLIAHYAFFLYMLGPIKYGISLYFTSMFIFGTFTLSHSHLPVTRDRLHWAEYSFLHTTNVNPSWWCDWAMGYLNYQVEHHLFPTMPNFRQRQISAQVKAYAERNGLPYQCISYPRAIWTALSNLAHVSEEIIKHKDE